MPFARSKIHSAESDTLKNKTIVSDDGSLAHHNSHAVIDHQASAYLGAGMYFYTREKATGL